MLNLATFVASIMISSTPIVETQTADNSKQMVHQVADDGAASDDVGWFSAHYPFGFNENLEPEVEENLIVLWALNAFVGIYAGPLWIPDAIVKQDAGEAYKDEALWHWIWDAVLYVGSIPFIYFAGLGAIHLMARAFWFGPVGAINLYDRHLKKARGKSAMRNQFLDDKFLRETSFASSGSTMQMGY